MQYKSVWLWNIGWTVLLYVLDATLIVTTFSVHAHAERTAWLVTQLLWCMVSVGGKTYTLRHGANHYALWLFFLADVFLGLERMCFVLWNTTHVSLPLVFATYAVHIFCVYTADGWSVRHWYTLYSDRAFQTFFLRNWIVWNAAAQKSYALPETCPICLEKMTSSGDSDESNKSHESNESSIAPRACLQPHWMHKACVLQWIQAIRKMPNPSYVCPVCRSEMVDSPL